MREAEPGAGSRGLGVGGPVAEWLQAQVMNLSRAGQLGGD
jgi:hypothetical protein